MIKYLLSCAAALSVSCLLPAQTINWEGDTSNDLTDADNWSSAPDFDGSEALLINDFSLSGRTLLMNTDISANRVDIGDGAGVDPIATINGDGTLTLTKSGLDNVSPTMLFRTGDGRRIDLNVNLNLDAGIGSGNFVAHFREQNNSSGGLNIYGNITQAAGESWEILANKQSARGNLRLFGQNEVDRIRVNGMDITIANVGAAGNAELIFNGGAFIFSGDRYTTPVANQLTMLSAATLSGQLRVTGDVNQGNQTLSLNGTPTQIMRFEPNSMMGTGQTVVRTANFTLDSMSSLSTGTLTIGDDIGNTADTGVLILGSGDVPTGAEFAAARTYNQSGGANTWRFSTPAAARRGGAFAARGSDLIISPGWAGIDDTTFNRNFGLGTAATLDGQLYAANSVIIQENINYTGTQRIITVSGPAAQIINEGWRLNEAPVHEISGQITGPASGDFILAVLSGTRQGSAGSDGGTGIVRFSNVTNNLSDANVTWLIGGTRGVNDYLPSGRIPGGDNGWDNGGGIAIFTDDLAFGGADEVVVRGGGSSGTNNGAALLFENRDGGEKTFARDFYVFQNDNNGKAAFGSYSGDVRYVGTTTLLGGGSNILVHTESGQFRWDEMTLTNNSLAGSLVIRKNGEGVFRVDDITVNGTFIGNYSLNAREGTVLWNNTGDIVLSGVTIQEGATLGGNGIIQGNTTIAGTLSPGNSPGLLTFGSNLTLQSSSTSFFEIDGTTRGVDHDAVDVTGTLNLNGTLEILFGFTPGISDTFNLFNAGSINGDFSSITFLNSGFDGSFDAATGVLSLTAIPEPSTYAAIAGIIMFGLVLYRRRKR